LAAHNVATYFAVPQFSELNLMRSFLAQHDFSQVHSIYIISSTAEDSLAPAVRYDEFGLPSSSPPWSPGSMVYLLLREMSPERINLPIEVVPAKGSINLPASALIVDMHRLLNAR
jgi:hypothetical protein